MLLQLACTPDINQLLWKALGVEEVLRLTQLNQEFSLHIPLQIKSLAVRNTDEWKLLESSCCFSKCTTLQIGDEEDASSFKKSGNKRMCLSSKQFPALRTCKLFHIDNESLIQTHGLQLHTLEIHHASCLQSVALDVSHLKRLVLNDVRNDAVESLLFLVFVFDALEHLSLVEVSLHQEWMQQLSKSVSRLRTLVLVPKDLDKPMHEKDRWKMDVAWKHLESFEFDASEMEQLDESDSVVPLVCLKQTERLQRFTFQHVCVQGSHTFPRLSFFKWNGGAEAFYSHFVSNGRVFPEVNQLEVACSEPVVVPLECFPHATHVRLQFSNCPPASECMIRAHDHVSEVYVSARTVHIERCPELESLCVSSDTHGSFASCSLFHLPRLSKLYLCEAGESNVFPRFCFQTDRADWSGFVHLGLPVLSHAHTQFSPTHIASILSASFSTLEKVSLVFGPCFAYTQAHRLLEGLERMPLLRSLKLGHLQQDFLVCTRMEQLESLRLYNGSCTSLLVASLPRLCVLELSNIEIHACTLVDLPCLKVLDLENIDDGYISLECHNVPSVEDCYWDETKHPCSLNVQLSGTESVCLRELKGLFSFGKDDHKKEEIQEEEEEEIQEEEQHIEF